MYIDTHCHYNTAQFDEDLDDAIDRASSSGISKSIVVGFDMPSSLRAVELAHSRPSLYAAIGIHPCDCQSWNGDAEKWLRDSADDPKVVAIGEIGLDYYRGGREDKDQVDVQESVL